MNAVVLPSYSDADLAALSPPELIDLLVRDEDRVPRNVIDECALRAPQMVETLAAELLGDEPWSQTATPGQWWLILHGICILGLIPCERAATVMIQVMRRLSLEEDDALVDWLSGYWPALFRNKPDTVQAQVEALARDTDINPYVGAQAFEVLIAAAARQGPQALNDRLNAIADWLADESNDWDQRLFVGNILLDFPRHEYRQLLERMAREQGDFVDFSVEDVRDGYATMVDRPAWSTFDDPWQFYAPEAIQGRQERWPAQYMHDELDASSNEFDPFAYGPPYVREEPRIGRNEPCPCGSGKKYKKCCLRQGAA